MIINIMSYISYDAIEKLKSNSTVHINIIMRNVSRVSHSDLNLELETKFLN